MSEILSKKVLKHNHIPVHKNLDKANEPSELNLSFNLCNVELKQPTVVNKCNFVPRDLVLRLNDLVLSRIIVPGILA